MNKKILRIYVDPSPSSSVAATTRARAHDRITKQVIPNLLILGAYPVVPELYQKAHKGQVSLRGRSWWMEACLQELLTCQALLVVPFSLPRANWNTASQKELELDYIKESRTSGPLMGEAQDKQIPIFFTKNFQIEESLKSFVSAFTGEE